jgi:ectoine hydroxylase-related dioxygenase (phytanoyl-CoA dioxygenase family)
MFQLARSITPDEVAAYNHAGVVLLKGVLDLRAVNTLRRCIDLAVSTLDKSPSGYDFTELANAYNNSNSDAIDAQSTGQHDVSAIMEHMRASGQPLLADDVKSEKAGSFFVDTAVSARIADFKRFVMRGAAPGIAAALMNASTVRHFDDQIFVKEPGTPQRAAFHQDASYFDIEGDQCCVLWIAVDPVPVQNGGMIYLRGSHRQGKRYAANVFLSQASLPGSEGEDLSRIEEHPEDYDLVSFDVEPGDILVHHYLTVHGTGGNFSRYQVRRAASIRYTGDDITFKKRPGTPARLHHSHDLADGEALNADDFPVVWKRPARSDAA